MSLKVHKRHFVTFCPAVLKSLVSIIPLIHHRFILCSVAKSVHLTHERPTKGKCAFHFQQISVVVSRFAFTHGGGGLGGIGGITGHP